MASLPHHSVSHLLRTSSWNNQRSGRDTDLYVHVCEWKINHLFMSFTTFSSELQKRCRTFSYILMFLDLSLDKKVDTLALWVRHLAHLSSPCHPPPSLQRPAGWRWCPSASWRPQLSPASCQSPPSHGYLHIQTHADAGQMQQNLLIWAMQQPLRVLNSMFTVLLSEDE